MAICGDCKHFTAYPIIFDPVEFRRLHTIIGGTCSAPLPGSCYQDTKKYAVAASSNLDCRTIVRAKPSSGCAHNNKCWDFPINPLLAL